MWGENEMTRKAEPKTSNTTRHRGGGDQTNKRANQNSYTILSECSSQDTRLAITSKRREADRQVAEDTGGRGRAKKD